jgi:hypothetical protein
MEKYTRIHTGKLGTKFPKGLTLVQTNTDIQYIYLWWPSLVLGKLGGALRVPMAC